MNRSPIIVRLWDYGWLCRDIVELQPAASDTKLIEEYVTSSAFHHSFLPSDKDEAGIHGPFSADRITAADFVPLHLSDLETYLRSVEVSERPGEDEEERAKIMPPLQRAFEGGSRCYLLRVDERNGELFHDWGWVFVLFREFVFISSERSHLERFIVGYD
jgi:hypothetical protein